MATLKFGNVTYPYKLKPLYLGVKQINKTIALENLKLFKSIAHKYNLSFILAYGTVLGAIRDCDFITHDEDTDLAICYEDGEILFSMMDSLLNEGFMIVRWDRRGLLSLMRKGEYIDIYLFRLFSANIRTCCGEPILTKFISNTQDIDFYGDSYRVPKDYNEYLEFNYGKYWYIPIVWTDFKISYFKKIFFLFKEHLKVIIPDWIFYKYTARLERKIIQKYIHRGLIHFCD